MIDWRDKDIKGKRLSGRTIASMKRLRKWQKRIRITNSLDRNLSFALGELNRMASALGIPRTIEEAGAVIYRRALNSDIIRGRSVEGMATASLYAACRQCKVSRTLEEIAEVSRVSKRGAARCYKIIAINLKLGILPTSALEYVPRFCSLMGLHDKKLQLESEEIIKRAEKLGIISGRGPQGIAASAIYISAKNSPFHKEATQARIAEISGVTEVTIRNGYKWLVKALNLERINT